MLLCSPDAGLAPSDDNAPSLLKPEIWALGGEGTVRPERNASIAGFRFRLTPLDKQAAGAAQQEHYVVARDLSERGFGFSHDHPLPFRMVRLTGVDKRLEEIGLANLEFTVVLRWCRFVAPGQYESGGRIARSRSSIGSVA